MSRVLDILYGTQFYDDSVSVINDSPYKPYYVAAIYQLSIMPCLIYLTYTIKNIPICHYPKTVDHITPNQISS